MENDKLIECKLEGYKSLDSRNSREEASQVYLDRLLFPLAVGGYGYVISQSDTTLQETIIAYIGSVIVLSFWILLYRRFNSKMVLRFSIMQEIEKELNFSAHRIYHCRRQELKGTRLNRYIFFWAYTILGLLFILYQICDTLN